MPGEEGSPDTLRGAMYGMALVLTVIFMPRGAAGFVHDLRTGSLTRSMYTMRRRLGLRAPPQVAREAFSRKGGSS